MLIMLKIGHVYDIAYESNFPVGSANNNSNQISTVS